MKTPALALAAFFFTTRLLAAETPLAIDQSRSHIEAVVMSSLENFTAKLTAYNAIVSVDLAEKRIVNAQLKFRLADLDTDNEKRDAEMRLWQQTDQFPECIYLLDTLKPAVGGTFKALGRFTLHGVTKTIIIPVTIRFTSPETCKIDGDLILDTTDFGLTPIRKYVFFTVSPTLQIKFHLEGRAPAGTN